MRLLLLLASATILTGCSSLRVQVGVLNPDVVRERAANDRLAATMPNVMAETPTSVADFFAERANIHGRLYGGLRQVYLDEATKLTPGSDERRQLEMAARSLTFPQKLRDDYGQWQTRALAVTATLQGLWPQYQAAQDAAAKLRLRNSLLAALDEREAIRDALDQALISDLDLQQMHERVASLPPEQQKAIIERIQQSVRHEVVTQKAQLFDPGGIQHSPYAYYVAKADEKDWAAKFDHSFGRGTFGNTDIAIKALGPGNFTIKGVSFNPADVAATASKVTSQTVLLAAQVAGVPVKLSGTPDATKPGVALAQSSNALATTLALNQRVDTRMIAHRDALRRIAAAIVNERNVVLSGSDAERKAALDSIKAVYESQASRLRVAVD